MIEAFRTKFAWLVDKSLQSLNPSEQIDVIRSVAMDDPGVVMESLAPFLNRDPDIDSIEWILPPPEGEPIPFTHLGGLFASTTLDYAVIAMSVREAAYTYELARSKGVNQVIEIGRYKGGSTLLLAGALGPDGEVWSVDLGTKEDRLREDGGRPYDEQLEDLVGKLGLNVNVVVGDSRSIELEPDKVDLVLIDGGHEEPLVRNDFERFGRRVRTGGSILFHDAFDSGPTAAHEGVHAVVEDVVSDKEFDLVAQVDSLAHVERVG